MFLIGNLGRVRSRLRAARHDLGFVNVNATGWIPSQRIRHAIYKRCFGVIIGEASVIYHGCEIRQPHDLRIGHHTSIGDRCILDARGGLTIGNSVNLSTGVWIWTADHDPQSRNFAARLSPVTIHDHAWLSCRSVILPGVTVGRGAVVAAGAVVAKDVADHTIVGGVPAKPIGRRREDLDYQLTSYIRFW